MKLLTWMHRKLRQTNNDSYNEYPHDLFSTANHQYHQKPSTGRGNWEQLKQQDSRARKSFTTEHTGDTEPPPPPPDDDDYFTDKFDGFLTIGTLGGDTFISEPETPIFAFSVETIAEKGADEATETELKLINDELEKVLGADQTKDDAWTDSSGRNSHVSNGRSSHGSTITLTGKSLEIPRESCEKMVCPLQGYLLGAAAVELPEKSGGGGGGGGVGVCKKERRTSLGELFQQHKVEEGSVEKVVEKGEKQAAGKNVDKAAVNLMRKILKRKGVHSQGGRGSGLSSGGSTGCAASAETKMNKILSIFHKKVHPEDSAPMRRIVDAPQSYRIKNARVSCRGRRQVLQDEEEEEEEEIAIAPQHQRAAIKKRHVCHYNKSDYNPIQFSFCSGGDSNGSRECWIKTDENYLVLEL